MTQIPAPSNVSSFGHARSFLGTPDFLPPGSVFKGHNYTSNFLGFLSSLIWNYNSYVPIVLIVPNGLTQNVNFNNTK